LISIQATKVSTDSWTQSQDPSTVLFLPQSNRL
jgi:hypothetical protein